MRAFRRVRAPQKTSPVRWSCGASRGQAPGGREQVFGCSRPADSSMRVIPEFSRIAPDVKLGEGVQVYAFVNLYGCEIGDGTRIGAFVEIQKNATIGKRCKISSHTFVCEGVTIED